MSLPALALLVWDIHSFRYIFIKPVGENFVAEEKLFLAEDRYWVIVGLVLLIACVVLVLLSSILLAIFIPFIIGIIAVPVYLYFKKQK